LARYAALRALAASLGGGCIVTAHTEDDQAETVLLHLLRGSGLDGLTGMRPRQGDLVRPFLAVSRAAIEAHCTAHDLRPRLDASNLSRAYRRNALRLDAIPLLEQFNPRLRPTLARTAAILARDAEHLRTQAAAMLETLLMPCEPDTLGLDQARLAALDAAMRARVLRLTIERLRGAPSGLSARQLASLDGLVCAGRAGRRGDLPGGVQAEAAAGCLLLRVDGGRGTQLPDAVPLPVPGSARFGAWRLEAQLLPAQSEGEDGGVRDVAEAVGSSVHEQPEGSLEVWCDGEAGGAPLVVRARRPGDRLRPRGLHGSKKVQDLLVDRKVPRAERDAVPIVVGPRGIIWVVGHALDEAVALRATSRVRLHLRAWRAENMMER
jgi:tRNA(Ile)-lysidine synthase